MEISGFGFFEAIQLKFGEEMIVRPIRKLVRNIRRDTQVNNSPCDSLL
jgi:hypothetical protein